MATTGVDENVWCAAAPALRGWVGGYSGYRQRGVPPVRHRGLPSPWLTVVLTLAEPLDVARHPDPSQPAGRFDTLVGGLHTRPALIVHDGAQSGVQVAVHPLAAPVLLGVPAGALASLDVPLDAVLGREGISLAQRLRETDGWLRRFAVLDAFFAARLSGARVGPGAAHPGGDGVGHAVTRLVAGDAVRDVAAGTGWSERHLRTLVRRATGLSPHDLARVARFDRVRRRAQSAGPRVRWSRLAAEGGYADQSHLVREFHAFAGAAPGRWLAEEFRSVQDLGAGTGPAWDA